MVGSNVGTKDLLPFACEIEGQALGKQTLHGLGQVAADDLVIKNVDALEDALIVFTPHHVGCVLALAHRVRQ